MSTNDARGRKAEGTTAREKRPMTYKEFSSFELPLPPSSDKEAKWPRIRLTKDTAAYAQYLSRLSRYDMRDLVIRALEFAFQNIEFRSVEVYDIDFVNRDVGAFTVSGKSAEGAANDHRNAG